VAEEIHAFGLGVAEEGDAFAFDEGQRQRAGREFRAGWSRGSGEDLLGGLAGGLSDSGECQVWQEQAEDQQTSIHEVTCGYGRGKEIVEGFRNA